MVGSCTLLYVATLTCVACFAIASGPQWDSFDDRHDLQLSIDSFHKWFFEHYDYYSSVNGGGGGHSKSVETSSAKELKIRPAVELRLTSSGDSSSSSSPMRIGVYASGSNKIPLNSPYLPVPLAMVLSEATIMAPPASPFFHPTQTRSSLQVAEVLRGLIRGGVGFGRPPLQGVSFTLLALALLHETYVVREKSFFAPYIRLLPAVHDIPQFYDSTELNSLRGTIIPRQVIDRNRTHTSQYQWVKRHIFSVYPDLWPAEALPGRSPLSGPLSRRNKKIGQLPPLTVEGGGGGGDRGAGSFEAWLWVNGILNSRTIWWDGAPHLVPFLDMINCGELADRSRIHSTVRKDGYAVTLSPQQFEAGVEIFENYGQPNPTYMLNHGFTLEKNGVDCASLTYDLAVELGGVAAKRLYVNNLGLKGTACVAYNPGMSFRLKGLGGILELLAVGRVASADSVTLASFTRQSVRRVLDTANVPLDRKAAVFVGKLLNRTLGSMASERELDGLVNSTSAIPASTFFRSTMIRRFVLQQRAHLVDTIEFLKSKLRRRGRGGPSSGGVAVQTGRNHPLGRNDDEL